MEHHFVDFKKCLRMVTWQLRVLGLWSPSYSQTCNNLYNLYAICIIVAANLHNLAQILYWILVPSDFKSLLLSAMLVFEETNVNVKLYGLLMYLNGVKRIVKHCNRRQPANAEQKNLATSTMWRFNLFHVFYTSSSGICCSFVIFSSLLASPVRLPAPGWYPFNVTQHFVSAFVHQTFGHYYVTFAHISIDCFSIGVMALVIVQCDLLINTLKNFTGTEVELLKNIKHHQEIILNFKVISGMLNWIVFGQYASSTITLCATLFQVTIVEPSDPIFVTMLVYATVMVGQLLLYCWWGNEVIVKSEEIPMAAFESKWIRASPKFQKDLVFFIHRTQTPLEFFGAGYFKVSLQNFMMILRHSYSFFAVLRQMNHS